MQTENTTDPIERTWPTLRQTHLDLCAWHLYQLVKPREGLLWDELSPAQKADYRRRVLEAAKATAVNGKPGVSYDSLTPVADMFYGIVNRLAHWLPSVDDERCAVTPIDRVIFSARAAIAQLEKGASDGPR